MGGQGDSAALPGPAVSERLFICRGAIPFLDVFFFVGNKTTRIAKYEWSRATWSNYLGYSRIFIRVAREENVITRPDWPANSLFFAFSRPLAEGWPSSAGRWPRLLIGEKILDSSQFSIVVGASLREKYSIVMNYMLCCL